MMVLAILSPLLAFPLVLATQLLEKWTMEPTHTTSAPKVSVRELAVVVEPEE
jgi:hypothetical protein